MPEKVLFCKKCVISNQRPNSTIEFKNKKEDKKEVINFLFHVPMSIKRSAMLDLIYLFD